MVIHKFDIIDKQNVCGKTTGKSDSTYNYITCLDCLIIEKREWERQVRDFKGPPKKNAIEGLEIVNERIEEITASTGSQDGGEK